MLVKVWFTSYEKTNEFKIFDGFASCRECFTTYVFRSGSKSTGTKNLTDHNCSKKDVNQLTLREVYLHLSSEISSDRTVYFRWIIQERYISATHRAALIDSIAN